MHGGPQKFTEISGNPGFWRENRVFVHPEGKWLSSPEDTRKVPGNPGNPGNSGFLGVFWGCICFSIVVPKSPVLARISRISPPDFGNFRQNVDAYGFCSIWPKTPKTEISRIRGGSRKKRGESLRLVHKIYEKTRLSGARNSRILRLRGGG